MKFLIEHPCNLRNVVIPFHECTDFSAKLIPLFLIKLIVLVRDRFEDIGDFALCRIRLTDIGIEVNL